MNVTVLVWSINREFLVEKQVKTNEEDKEKHSFRWARADEIDGYAYEFMPYTY